MLASDAASLQGLPPAAQLAPPSPRHSQEPPRLRQPQRRPAPSARCARARRHPWRPPADGTSLPAPLPPQGAHLSQSGSCAAARRRSPARARAAPARRTQPPAPRSAARRLSSTPAARLLRPRRARPRRGCAHALPCRPRSASRPRQRPRAQPGAKGLPPRLLPPRTQPAQRALPRSCAPVETAPPQASPARLRQRPPVLGPSWHRACRRRPRWRCSRARRLQQKTPRRRRCAANIRQSLPPTGGGNRSAGSATGWLPAPFAGRSCTRQRRHARAALRASSAAR